MRTLQDLAKEAIEVQDACNLSGVVHGWSRAVSELRELLPNVGTDEFNNHPINQLWADKCSHLAGTQFGDAASDAWNWALQQIGLVEKQPAA